MCVTLNGYSSGDIAVTENLQLERNLQIKIRIKRM